MGLLMVLVESPSIIIITPMQMIDIMHHSMLYASLVVFFHILKPKSTLTVFVVCIVEFSSLPSTFTFSSLIDTFIVCIIDWQLMRNCLKCCLVGCTWYFKSSGNLFVQFGLFVPIFVASNLMVFPCYYT